jgi:predicted transcriptional regulator of viral defense system
MKAGITSAGRDDVVKLVGRGQRFVTVEEAARTLSLSQRDAARKLSRWADAGWFRRVRRGLYIPVPVEAENPAAWSEDPLYLADVVWSPCYFTGWTAANHWSLTEQVFRTTIVKTSARVRASRQRLLDHEYIVAHVRPEEIWGAEPSWRHDRRVLIADRTRTIIDALDEPALVGGIRHASELVGAYLADADGGDLIAYGDRLGNRAVFKRLGYLLDALRLHRPNLDAECRRRVSAGLSLLDPSGPHKGKAVTPWGLRVNVQIQPEGAS